jgi:hypothetical protein
VLTVGATGDNLSYQWYKDDQEINVTEAMLEITSAQTEDAGTYKVKVYNQCGEVWSSECVVTVTFKTILEVTGETGDVQLLQNKPNPFDKSTRIEFILPTSGKVKMTLSNLLSDINVEIVNFEMNAGLNSIELNAEKLNLPSGVYIYSIEYNGKKLSRRMIINR